MALADPAHAKALSDEARAARSRITEAAAKKVDPSTLRQEIAATAVGIERALNTSTRGRAPSGNDFIQAACAAIAGVLLGAKRNGETFARDVRETQGLRAGAGLAAGLSVPPRAAQSGAGLAPSEIPGVSSAAAAAAAAAGARRPAAAPPPPPDDDYEEEDAEFASEAFGREREFADALTDRGPAATAAVLADMDTPSVMRKVDHGVTVGHQVHKLADDIGSNDSTMRMLASLDFNGDPGPDAVDALLEDAITIGEEPPPPPGPPPSAAEIERADRASAATQWPDRAPKGLPKVHSELGLDDAVKTSDLDMMTAAYFVDVLGEEAK